MVSAVSDNKLRAAHQAYGAAIAAGYMPRGQGRPSAAGEAARALGIPHQTMLSRLKLAIEKWGEPDIEVPALAIDPLEIRARRDEASELRKRVKDLERQLLEANTVNGVIQHLAGQKISPPRWMTRPARIAKPDKHVAMTMWADWHLGEVVDLAATHGLNEYSSEIAAARVERLVNKTIELSQHHGPGNYAGAVVMLVGDMVSGAIHDELAKTDDAEVIPATIHAIELIVAGLTRLADYFGQLYVPAVPGNHGRNTIRPEYKRLTHNSFDWLIYQMAARQLRDDKRITFDIPQAGELVFKVFDTRFYLTHGDMLGVAGGDGIIGSLGPILRGAFKVGRQAAALGQDFDVLCIGHWHQPIQLGHVIVANCLKGFDEYAAKRLRAMPSTPSQPLWFEHPRHGRVSSMEIYVEDPQRDTSAPWVSIQARADR